MKVTLDLTRLLEEGKITQAEFDKFNALSGEATSFLAYNILMGLGIIAVCAGALMLVPSPITAIAIGFFVGLAGVILMRTGGEKWKLLAQICLLIGSSLLVGGVIMLKKAFALSCIALSVLFFIEAIIAQSQMLIMFSVTALALSVAVYTHKTEHNYYLKLRWPTLMIFASVFVSGAAYWLSQQVKTPYKKLAVAAMTTSLVLINFWFWVGSMEGDKAIPRWVFSIVWALLLVGAVYWAISRNKQRVLNGVAACAAIHFFTQYFDYFTKTGWAYFFAGLFAIGFAVLMRFVNRYFGRLSSALNRTLPFD